MSKKGIIWLCLTIGLLPSAGCVTLDILSPGGNIKERPPQGPVTQIQMMWGTKIDQVPDLKGALVPGLAGHVYLMGPQTQKSPGPVQGNGSLWFLITYTGQNGQPQNIKCEYPKRYLDSVMTKDPYMGWGYRILIPWEQYQPWVKNVRVQVKFVPEHGEKVYSIPHTFALNQEGIQNQLREFPMPGANAGPDQRALANQGW